MNISEMVANIDLVNLAERAGAAFEHANGHGIRGACPLHHGDNKTAFSIYQDETTKNWYWHCHTKCGGGDALDFYRHWHGIQDVKEAALQLAAEYNLDLDWKTDPVQAAAEQERRLRVDVLDASAEYFQSQLWASAGEHALNYLLSRGFSQEAIVAARWGYSDSSTGLYHHLRNTGMDLGIASKTGLIRADLADYTANGGGKTAGPNGWITIPYIQAGRAVYFSSRAVEVPGIDRPDRNDKNRNLPGHAPAYRAEVRNVASIVIVEGAFDAASLKQMGQSAWAMGGLNGVDEKDIAALKRRKGGVYLSTDNDEKGQEKITGLSTNVTKMCNALGALTMIMPPLDKAEGKDWNDVLKASLEPYRFEVVRRAVAEATPWLEYRMVQAAKCGAFERDDRMTEVGKLLASVPAASRPYYFTRAQKLLGLGKADVKSLVANAMGKRTNHTNSEIREGQLFFLEEPMGNFWAKISRELIVDNGQDQPDVRFELEGGLDDGTDLHRIEIEASEFNQLTWVTKRWGSLPTFYVARKDYYKMIRAIQEVSSGDLIRERQYAYTGWTRIDGEWCYLVSNGRISASGLDTQTRVDLGDPNLSRYELPAPPTDPGRAVRAVRASLDYLRVGKRRVTAMIWAAMYAAPLTSIIPLYAMLWVYGQTQTGKSTITMCGLTHFGKHFITEQQYHAPAEWLSSFTGLEELAFTLKDTTLVIDDYAPRVSSKAESTMQAATAQALIRTVGNRSAKRRAANYQRSPRPPRGMVISTAENPLVGQSTVGRVIYVPVNKGDVIGDKENQLLGEAQSNGQAGVLADAMSLYVQWLAKHWDEIEASAQARVKKHQEAFIRNSKQKLHPRLPNYYGVLVASQELALEAFVDMHLLPQLEADEINRENQEAIAQVIIQQSINIGAESPVRKVFTAIGSTLERCHGYLCPRKANEFKPPVGQELIGWYDPDEPSVVWFNTLTILELAKRFWADLDENLDIRDDMLKQQMDAVGVINRGDSQHLEKKVTINGREGRYLEVNVHVVETLFDLQLIRQPESKL